MPEALVFVAVAVGLFVLLDGDGRAREGRIAVSRAPARSFVPHAHRVAPSRYMAHPDPFAHLRLRGRNGTIYITREDPHA